MNFDTNLHTEEREQLQQGDMFDHIQTEDQSSTVPEEFRPFGCTEFSESLIDYAREYVNETEETRIQSLETIKEIVKDELDGYLDMDDIILLCFLRSRRFNIQQTCYLMRAAKEFLHTYRYIFEQIDTEVVRRVVECKIANFLPYRDSKSRAIVFFRTECWNPDVLKVEDMMFGHIVALHVNGENPVSQVAGYVVIVDFKNLSLKQVKALSSWMLIGIQMLQKCNPFSVKEFHLINAPMLFRIVWKIINPLIREDIKKRITIYNTSDLESLHRNIPPCILPKELGGQLGPCSYEHWATDIPMITKKFFERCHRLLTP